jgi:hypothetical protein
MLNNLKTIYCHFKSVKINKSNYPLYRCTACCGTAIDCILENKKKDI